MELNSLPLAPCDSISPMPTGSQCRQRKRNCCDESCLENIARRECKAACDETSQAERDEACCSGMQKPSCSRSQAEKPASSPCKKHSRAVRERYGATLEALGCICRALLARNLESCCATPRRSTSHQRVPESTRSTPPTSITGHDGLKARQKCPKECASTQKLDRRTEPRQCCNDDDDCDSTRQDACSIILSEPKTSRIVGNNRYPRQEHCDDPPRSKNCSLAKDTCPKASCCTSSKDFTDPSSKQAINAVLPDASQYDIEKGATNAEHVSLSVQGLTCVGCENKLFRSLDAIPSVRNVKTSLVLLQAEFDLDLRASSVNDVIRSIERATGFSCERIISDGQQVDVNVVGDPTAFVHRYSPKGVTEMVVLSKQTVRITYDAKIIGARDLVETGFNTPVQLAALRPDPALAAGSRHVQKTTYMTLLSVVLTVPVLILAWAPLPPHEILYSSLSLALATIVQVVVAGPFYPSALRSLIFTRVIEMDLLIVLSTSTAYIFSVVSFVYQVQGRPLSTGEFFETSILLVTLIMVGRLVSAIARQKAVESISIRSLQVDTALLVNSEGMKERAIDIRLLQYGDIFKVVPDSRIATDGIVISGSSEVNESTVTGESVPVEKTLNSPVVAGSVNGSGTLLIKLTRLSGENTISQIADMVDQAKYSKPKTQETADRVAGYFVPVVVALTMLTFVIWIAVGSTIRHQTAKVAVVQAITYSISVLIVSCPCAVGLAVPMVVVIAGGVAAQRGVIFKSAEALETARKVSHVVFDKTGTLTQGQLSIVAEEYLSESRASTASLVLGLTTDIKHPVSSAIAKHLSQQVVEPTPLQNVTSVPGKGLEAVWNGLPLRGGNSLWQGVEDSPAIQSLLAQGLTVFCVSSGNKLLAAFGLEDTLRPDAGPVIAELTRRNIRVSILSGDDPCAVASVAAKLGIPPANTRSRCSPADKQQHIHDLLSTNGETVLFCGDGTNDAVALAQASVGVHMSEGSDVAKSAADVVLVRPALSGVLTLIDLSRASFHRIVFNFAWAFLYNLFAILLAAGAFVHARIPPQYAGLGELVSVLPVVLVALQLKWAREF